MDEKRRKVNRGWASVTFVEVDAECDDHGAVRFVCVDCINDFLERHGVFLAVKQRKRSDETQ